MNSTTKSLLGVTVLLFAGLLIAPAAAVAQEGQGHVGHQMGAQAKGAAEPAGCGCANDGMSGQHLQRMAALKSLLTEAKNAAVAQNATAAAGKIGQALALLEQYHKAAHQSAQEHMAKMQHGPEMPGMKCQMCGKMMAPSQKKGIVNARCPLMGSPLDPKKVTEALTRTWRGQQVGFCCGGCPDAWDRLSDADKQKKLEASMATPQPHAGHQGH